MSQPYQPDQGQPYQQQGGGVPPQQPQFGGGMPPQQFGGPPMAPPVQRQGNIALALLVGVVAAVVAAGVYAFILKSTFDEETGEVTQIGYVAVGVGALIGFTIGKLGGRNVGLWVVGGVLALIAAMVGELYGYAWITSEFVPGAPSAPSLFFKEFGDLFDAWKEDAEGLTYAFVAISPIAAIGTAISTNRN